MLITGLPGSGKTTVAREYAARSGALHLNSDLLRRELDLMGRYQPEDKQKVYDALLLRAGEALSAGRDVVVDGTFHREAARGPFRALARRYGVPLLWIKVLAQQDTVRQRLRKPRTDSEADFAVYGKIRAEAEPLPDPHLELWSDEASPTTLSEEIEKYAAQHRPI